MKFEVRKLSDLIAKVLPHFRDYPLRSSKQQDDELFGQVCQLIDAGRHLEIDGMTEMVKLAKWMNPTGKRKYSGSEILSTLRSGEGIVYATGNRGET